MKKPLLFNLSEQISLTQSEPFAFREAAISGKVLNAAFCSYKKFLCASFSNTDFTKLLNKKKYSTEFTRFAYLTLENLSRFFSGISIELFLLLHAVNVISFTLSYISKKKPLTISLAEIRGLATIERDITPYEISYPHSCFFKTEKYFPLFLSSFSYR